jgi:2-C-methyl-D-erythritol 2,4-cyclodiphosphate synthase
MLGAVALGDIGQHFPPDDRQWRDVDSSRLLAVVSQKLSDLGWRLVNLDLTIACESPRIVPHVPAMRQRLAAVLEVPAGSISVKATTTEKLGFCGRGEGVAALAVVLVQGGE